MNELNGGCAGVAKGGKVWRAFRDVITVLEVLQVPYVYREREEERGGRGRDKER